MFDNPPCWSGQVPHLAGPSLGAPQQPYFYHDEPPPAPANLPAQSSVLPVQVPPAMAWWYLANMYLGSNPPYPDPAAPALAPPAVPKFEPEALPCIEPHREERKGRRRPSIEKVCVNCGTSNTPFWRKDKVSKQPICNACGLYAAHNHCPRPRTLWKVERTEQVQQGLS